MNILPLVSSKTTGIASDIDVPEDYTGMFIALGTQVIDVIESLSIWADDKKSIIYKPEYGETPGVSGGIGAFFYVGLNDEWIDYNNLPEGYMYRDDEIDSISNYIH